MDFINIDQPMDIIQEWQDWYRKQPKNFQTETKAIQKQMKTKAEEHFADTIAEFCSEISGKEMYEAFYAAALQNMEHHKKEYQKAKELIDLLSTRKMEE
jgi:hypothetical protein